MTKYCIVSGIMGLNDFFNTFFHACRKVEYGIQSGIDIKLALHWNGMGDMFWEFFQPTDKISAELRGDEIVKNIHLLKPYQYNYIYNTKWIYIEKELKPENLKWQENWDFYIEHFIRQWRYAEYFFYYLVLTQDFKKHIKELQNILDNDYLCLNFRMQEMIGSSSQTNREYLYKQKIEEYSNIIKQNINTTNKKICLCTDNIDLVNAFVDNKKVFSFGYANRLLKEHPSINSIDRYKPIHLNYYENLGMTQYDICKYSFTDYILMAMSSDLIPSEYGHFGKRAKELKLYLDSNPLIKQSIL